MTSVVGTCMEMCPAKEMHIRETKRLLHPFEILSGTEHDRLPKCDKTKAVKQFQRSAAGHKLPSPSEIRPPDVLRKTVNYLFKEIIPRKDVKWVVVYDFVFDRLRAVRQDLFIQQAESGCIDIIENIINFYIYSSYVLCENTKDFDLHINNTHLQECLKRLLVLYAESADDKALNRPKFEALYLLHNLGALEAMHHYFSLPQHLQRDPVIKRGAVLQKAYMERNFVRFFKLVNKLTIFELCCVHQHLQRVRTEALRMLNFAFSAKNCQFPLRTLSRWLCVSNENCMEICQYYGLEADLESLKFLKSSWDFKAAPFPSFREAFIDDKLKSVDLHTLFFEK